MRHLPQLRIIQQQFDRPDKRSYSSTASSGKVSTEKRGSCEDESNAKLSNSDRGDSPSSSSEPPTKIRKKPGRKPNPASPELRKEQNRAAQRAFRDRKERHLQEMEVAIKELKETNTKLTQRSQQDAQQFKTSLETLQSENYYLRQVVLSFEAALSKSGNSAILHEVKTELYHRHYEKYAAKSQPGSPPPPGQDTESAIPSLFIPNATLPQQGTEGVSRAQERPLSTTETSMTTTITTSATCSKSAIPPMSKTSTPPSSSSSSSPKTPTTSMWDGFGEKPTEAHDSTIFSTSSIVYKAPTSCSQQPDSNSGKLVKATSPFEPMAVPIFPRSFFTETGAYLGKRPEYTNCDNVFDALQSSHFPPGTLQSIISGLSTPQEIVNDASLLDQLHSHHRPLRDPVMCAGQAAITFSTTALDSPSNPSPLPPPTATACGEEEEDESSRDNEDEFEISTTLGLDDGLKQQVIPSHRLQLEIKVLASAPPAVDPNIDGRIYGLPHDPRIDLIPCPRLRAQMILHQKRFDVEELCTLLLDGAKCHGHPLDPHSWELPESFFDRYGFLLGEDMLRHRNKVWPQND